MTFIQSNLFQLQEKEYGDFIHKLTPTLPRDYFIGVRVPLIRKLAKEISLDDSLEFFKELPHRYYEENMLHGFLLDKIKDYDLLITEINRFLPYINNWATCDTTRPKSLSKKKDMLLLDVKKWVKSKDTYTIRFSIGILQSYFLDKDFKKEHLLIPLSINSDEYYVNIMIAWYYATALAKHYEDAIKIVESNKLDKWTHNKTIQKAIESYRISDIKKEYLRTLKRK